MSNFRLPGHTPKGFDPNTLKLGDLVQLFRVATLSGLNVRSFGSAFRSMSSESVQAVRPKPESYADSVLSKLAFERRR